MKKILFYGDSNTYGYDPRGLRAGRYAAEHRWPDILASELAGSWIVEADGMNGRPIAESDFSFRVLERSIKEASPLDYFAVMLGSNDIAHGGGESAKSIAGRMEAMIDFVEGLPVFRDAGATVILIADPLISGGGPRGGPPREYAKTFTELAEEYAEIARRRKLLFVNTQGWEIDFAFDGGHFSEKGCVQFAEHMKKYLLSLG